jgi:alpha-mannosidase
MSHAVRWTVQKIAQRLNLIEPFIYRQRQALPHFRCKELSGPHVAPPVGIDVDDSSWPVIKPETYWGHWWTDFVLRSSFQVPEDWEGGRAVALYLPLGEAGDFSHPEALIYIDGVPYAACDRHHREVILPVAAQDGQPHLLALHGWTGLGGLATGEPSTKLFMHPCALVQIDQPLRDFMALARVTLGVVQSLDKDHPAYSHLLNALDDAFKVLDTREPIGEAFYASVEAAHAILRQGVEEAGPSLAVDIIATGHAHLDMAWLWTLGQTRHKAARTFHTVIRLMEQFPDYHFTQSQPQLYEMVRQDHPSLFEQIKQQVAEGRWEPIGGMWVEADCNLSGAESLARQFLLGRTFFRQHFGPDAESPVLWLPDVFGYTWSLPQLIKQAGMNYFFTTKIGWNQYNRLPYDSFWWQGLDGSRVLTHFATTPGAPYASTYNATASPEEVLGTWRNFQQKETSQQLLMAYGWGDGGGGPTREMLENIREMEDFPALPRVRQGSAGDFFHRLEVEAGDRLPVWNGELYLEYHRGTYTTQARNKRANRKAEFALHDAEFLAVLASVLEPSYHYPVETLRRAWELVCLNQFHDIIPGSSMTMVYVESLQQYEEVQKACRQVKEASLSVIASKLGGDLLLINPTSFPRTDLAWWAGELPAGHCLQLASGLRLPVQPASGGMWIAPNELAPYSVTPLVLAEGEAPSLDTGLTATPALLENAYLRVEFNSAGDIIRIYDKSNQREVLPEGAIANQLQAFEDRPLDFDAWDIDIFYDDKMWIADPATSIGVTEAGPLRGTLEIRRQILHSEVVQHVSLAYNSPRLDFDTTVNWQERHILLKTAFPVDILSPLATYEIQWGNIQRPTHHNTSWDWARFEVCAQKWADLSEGGYGVSLLNDCKYGYDIRDHVLRLSLLRSSTLPDPLADQGEHHFTYSLLPHKGGWEDQTISAAYALNDPIIVVSGAGGTPVSYSLLATDQPHVVIETVKQAEDGRGMIVRLYESQRRRGEIVIRTGFPLAGAWHTNLLEEEQAGLKPEGYQVSLPVKPYEIVTLRLLPAGWKTGG